MSLFAHSISTGSSIRYLSIAHHTPRALPYVLRVSCFAVMCMAANARVFCHCGVGFCFAQGWLERRKHPCALQSQTTKQRIDQKRVADLDPICPATLSARSRRHRVSSSSRRSTCACFQSPSTRLSGSSARPVPQSRSPDVKSSSGSELSADREEDHAMRCQRRALPRQRPRNDVSV
eukprot:242577-Rhodomonas_salina.2